MPLFQDKFGSTQQAEVGLIDAFMRRRRKPVQPQDGPPLARPNGPTVPPSDPEPAPPHVPLFPDLLNEDQRGMKNAFERRELEQGKAMLGDVRPMPGGPEAPPEMKRSYINGEQVQLEKGAIYDENYNKVGPEPKKSAGIYAPDGQVSSHVLTPAKPAVATQDKYDKYLSTLPPDQSRNLLTDLRRTEVGVTQEQLGTDPKTKNLQLSNERLEFQREKEKQDIIETKARQDSLDKTRAAYVGLARARNDLKQHESAWKEAEAFAKRLDLNDRLKMEWDKLDMMKDDHASKILRNDKQLKLSQATRLEAQARERADRSYKMNYNTGMYEWASEQDKAQHDALMDQANGLVNSTLSQTPEPAAAPQTAPTSPAQAPRPAADTERETFMQQVLDDPDIPVEARKAIMEEWDMRHGRKPGPAAPERFPVQTTWDSRPPGQRFN